MKDDDDARIITKVVQILSNPCTIITANHAKRTTNILLRRGGTPLPLTSATHPLLLEVMMMITIGGHHQNCSRIRISPLFILLFLNYLTTLTQTAARPLLRLGVSFSPAGLLTPFHLGASHQLQQFGLITPHVALAGASGGALAAVTTALEVCEGSSGSRAWELSPLEASVYISKQCRDYGARLTLRKALDEVLAKTLPADSHEELNRRPAPCTVAFTSIRLPTALPSSLSLSSSIVESVFTHQFQSKEDVIDCLRASCNIPLYFNGNHLWVETRGMNCIDGYFSVHPSRFGCPHTGASEREIIVSPYPASLTKLDPYRTRPAGSEIEYDVITPDLLDETAWPFSFPEILRMSFTAPASSRDPSRPISDEEIAEKYEKLYRAGQEAVIVWHATKKAW